MARACGAGKVREQLLYEECSLVKKEGRTSGVIDVVVSAGLTAEDERRNAALDAELGGCRVVSCRVSECLTVVVVPQAAMCTPTHNSPYSFISKPATRDVHATQTIMGGLWCREPSALYSRWRHVGGRW